MVQKIKIKQDQDKERRERKEDAEEHKDFIIKYRTNVGTIPL